MGTQAPSGKWKSGVSGNPAGRKPGSGEVAKMRSAMAQHIPALIAKLLERAMDGDIGAARLLLERTIAPLKASEEPLNLALPGGTLTEQGRAVLSAVAAGSLPPGQGAALMASLGTMAKLTEVDDLEHRISMLETRGAPKRVDSLQQREGA